MWNLLPWQHRKKTASHHTVGLCRSTLCRRPFSACSFCSHLFSTFELEMKICGTYFSLQRKCHYCSIHSKPTKKNHLSYIPHIAACSRGHRCFIFRIVHWKVHTCIRWASWTVYPLAFWYMCTRFRCWRVTVYAIQWWWCEPLLPQLLDYDLVCELFYRHAKTRTHAQALHITWERWQWILHNLLVRSDRCGV